MGELSGIPKVSWRIVKEHEEHLGGPGDSQEVLAVSEGCLGGVLGALGGCLGGVQGVLGGLRGSWRVLVGSWEALGGVLGGS